ncbi:copper chaperone PCu(A)C [Emcibacter sp. SYSU 3D8]|uniref:copper chaperone PCu(A)C n=1 Tax=Emcibacter sp. SYSU 3D8 TaxID=3133969 RepID=UPI0031FE79A6
MFRTATALMLLVSIMSGHAFAAEYKAGPLTITDPWSRATPGGSKVGAGYLTIANTGAADRLLAVEAPEIAGKVELHEVVESNGTMSMQHRPEGLAVPANGTLTLKPRSFHIMFMSLKQPLREGDSFPGVLRFEKAGAVDVRFDVAPVGAAAPHSAGHHQHMGH